MRALALALLPGCSLLGGGPDFTVSGRVLPMSTAHATTAKAAPTITHVMAVDPQTAAPHRTSAAVASDGSFELAVDAGRPYVFVFVDSTAVGADMAVALFRAGTLDTISPQLAGHLELGDVKVDPAQQTATAGIGYAELIASLGLDDATAEYLGSVDDLSLRYANPDIDGDGVLDLDQDHQFALDFHVRSTMHKGSASGARVTIADLTDQFLPTSGYDVATPVFDLTSAYVLYPASFDSTNYVATGVPTTQPVNGAAFAVTMADGSAPTAASSFSALGYGDTRGWGPDYNFDATPGLELPGSAGVPATLAYTLGASGTTLTFTNVVTQTRAAFTDGALAIFLRLDTSGGQFATVEYQWMKRGAAWWTPATPDEIAVTIGSDGGYVSVHRAPSWRDEAGFAIPAQPTGSFAWPLDAMAPADVCGLAVSYDDKLGMRHFIGGADPLPGVTCTP